METISNGSKWYGEEPDSISTLLTVLKNNTIEDHWTFKFKSYTDVEKGKFEYICSAPICKENGKYVFFGNFIERSHVFNIATDDPEIIKQLRTAIMSNPGYKAITKILRKKAQFKR